MTKTTDANGRQRTPTDATRPLRETVAEAMHRVAQEEQPGVYDDWQMMVCEENRTGIFVHVPYIRKEADAAIAAMVTALLSDTAVEAGSAAMCGPERKGEWGYEIIHTAHRAQYVKALESSLRRIGAVEGERQ